MTSEINSTYNNPLKTVRKKIGSWFLKHPNLWTNPLSVSGIFRGITGRFRILPDFIIIGANKCGTTSLYDYLIQHENIHSALWKELFFFDRYYPRGMNWYRANFPFIYKKFFKEKFSKEKFITGEASPTYLIHPLTPKRIQKELPKVKLIVLLRDPVDRAFSHYQMEKRLGYETLSFEDALEIEEKRLEGEREKMIEDENYFSYDLQKFSYLTRGIYIDQLKNWLEVFPKDQLLVLQTEEFLENPSKIYKHVLKFLGLPETDLKSYKKLNVGNYNTMDKKIREKLIEFYKPYNQRLYKYLKTNFNWGSNE